jgi:glutathione S-transferase
MRSATLSDPRKIAIYLENAYPARPVFPDGSRAVQILFAHYVQHVFTRPLLPIMVPMSHHRLPELDQQFLRPSTSSSADRVMPSYAAGPQRDAAWAAVKEQFDFLAKILDENLDAGSVVQGHQVTYADFVLCSVLMWIEKVAPRDGWQLVRQWNNGRWANVWDACRPHMEVR